MSTGNGRHFFYFPTINVELKCKDMISIKLIDNVTITIPKCGKTININHDEYKDSDYFILLKKIIGDGYYKIPASIKHSSCDTVSISFNIPVDIKIGEYDISVINVLSKKEFKDILSIWE